MDERFFMYFEHAVLCRRTREVGWLVYFLPQVEVFRHGGASSQSRSRAIWDLHNSAFLYHRKRGRHGPFGLYSFLTLVGLTGRALVRLATSMIKRSKRT